MHCIEYLHDSNILRLFNFQDSNTYTDMIKLLTILTVYNAVEIDYTIINPMKSNSPTNFRDISVSNICLKLKFKQYFPPYTN